MNYEPLSPAEIEKLTCMQAGAPWAQPTLAALVEVIAIYDKLRAEGKRPFDPASLPKAEHDAYWAGDPSTQDRASTVQAPAPAHPEALADAYGELQALRNHVGHWRRSGIDDAALKRADDALAAHLAGRAAQAPAVKAEPLTDEQRLGREARLRAAGMGGLLSEILGKGALSHYGDADLIERVEMAVADQEAAASQPPVQGIEPDGYTFQWLGLNAHEGKGLVDQIEPTVEKIAKDWHEFVAPGVGRIVAIKIVGEAEITENEVKVKPL